MAKVNRAEFPLPELVQALILFRDVVTRRMLHQVMHPLFSDIIPSMIIELLFKVLGIVKDAEAASALVEMWLNIKAIQVNYIYNQNS